MFDDFDPFGHSGDDGDSLYHDDGQHDDLQENLIDNDHSSLNDDFGDHHIVNSEDIGSLTPSDKELRHLETLEELINHPEHHENQETSEIHETHESHHEISFGETVSCSDCSGSCAAYCASIFK